MPLKYRKCLLPFHKSTAGNICIHCFMAEPTRPTEPFPGPVHYQEEQIKENRTQNHNKPKGLNVLSGTQNTSALNCHSKWATATTQTSSRKQFQVQFSPNDCSTSPTWKGWLTRSAQGPHRVPVFGESFALSPGRGKPFH